MNELLATPVRNVIECIESWHDTEGNWYRIYSDGFCEQSGFINDSRHQSIHTINLHKSYINNNYFVSITRTTLYNVAPWASHTNYVNNVKPNSFDVSVSDEGSGDGKIGSVKWYASGFIS